MPKLPKSKASSGKHHKTTHKHLNLPQEILELIIDELLEFEIKWLPQAPGLTKASIRDLQTCNKVSRVFHQRARKHIFSKVEIEIEPCCYGCKRTELLRRLVQSDRNVAQDIQSLTVTFAWDRKSNYDDEYRSYFTDIFDEDLAGIFEALTGLRTLKLDMTDTEVTFWSFEDDISSALLSVPKNCPRLTTLWLESRHQAFPLDFISSFANLKRLAIFDSSITSTRRLSGLDSASKLRDAPQLETLEMYVTTHENDFFQRRGPLINIAPMLGRLKQLRLDMTFPEFTLTPETLDSRNAEEEDITAAIAAVSHSVEVLDVDCGAALFHTAHPLIRISGVELPALREFVLAVRITHLETILITLVQTVKRFTASRSVETIVMKLDWNLVRNFEHLAEENLSLLLTKWHELDESLASLPNLRKLAIEVGFGHHPAGSGKVFHERFLKEWNSRNVFPLLSVKTGVVVTI